MVVLGLQGGNATGEQGQQQKPRGHLATFPYHSVLGHPVRFLQSHGHISN
jgi:hypothetical protein|tara:strand:+ start:1153 stop:1302 length:150 start_codon:yes stop_codon:yes gene_type:complete